MKFALALNHLAWTRGDRRKAVERTIADAQLADAAGFDSLWINEDPDGWDAFAVLSAIARETERIRLGPGVTNPFHRHPNAIASAVSTLDLISDGRAFLGLGRGQPEWYAEALGIPRHPPLALLAETLDLLGQWWSDDHQATADAPLKVTGWERTVHPLTRPPIYLAAAGPRALDLAGQLADGVLFNELASPEAIGAGIGRVRAAATAAGRDPDALAFFVNPGARITDEPEPLLERKKGFIATVYSLPGMERLLATPEFDVDSIIAEIRRAMRTDEILARGGGFTELRRHGDLTAAKRAIPTALVAHLAAIGSFAEVKRRLQWLAESGATHVFVDREALLDPSDNLQRLMHDLN